MQKDIKILAIETSCDETAASVIGEEKGKPVVLSNVVSSQIDLHAKTGGIVPEVASRAHMEAIIPVVTEALLRAKHQNKNIKKLNHQEAIEYLQNEITHVAVTAGPGLIGSLLVGFNAAKTIAYSLGRPIIPVNHIEGHIYSAICREITNSKLQISNKIPNDKSQISNESTDHQVNELTFPVLALTVSGGHTSLTLLKDHIKYETIGETKDDAAGEAFDKVAKLLELGYPGGPVVSKLAEQFRNSKEYGERSMEKNSPRPTPHAQLVFPRPIMNDGTFNFSFSGLKTAVLQHVLNIKKERKLTEEDKKEICAAFEDAAVDVLTTKAMRAVEKYKPKTLVLAGGVAANKHLRSVLKTKVDEYNGHINLLIPPIELCGDNAAMIGIAAFYHLQKGDVSTWDKINVDSNLEIGSRS